MDIIPQIIINSLVAGAIYALISLGFNLIYGATKFFNLAHGIVVVIGGYSILCFVKFLGLNIYLGVVISVIISGILGYCLDRFVYLPLKRKKASNMVLLVASLGIFTALQGIISIIFSSQFQSLSENSEQVVFSFFNGFITETQIIILISLVLIGLGLILLLHKTQFGREVRAINDDEEVAKIIGIHTNKIIGRVFFIGSAIAGYAGILVGYDTGLEPTMGLSLLLKGVIASIIGGVGSIYGGILGAFLLGFVENFGILKISGGWKDAIAFGLLIIFLIFRPRGIINK